MSILLFGASGQVGRALVGALAGREVVAVDRHTADFLVPGQLAHCIERHRPRVLINAAAYTAVDKAEAEPEIAARVNAGAVQEIAEASAALGIPVMHYSTDYVFDGEKPRPYLETDAPAPLGVYGRTKLDGEVALARNQPDHLVFRTSWVHSATGISFASKIIAMARVRDRLSVVADQFGAPTSAALIARVSMMALARRESGRPIAPGTYHLTAAGETTWLDYARHVVEGALQRGTALRLQPEDIAATDTASFPSAARRPANSRLSTEKLARALDFAFPHWKDGVDATLDGMKERGNL